MRGDVGVVALRSESTGTRSCTDVLCCVAFVIVILGYIALGTVVSGDCKIKGKTERAHTPPALWLRDIEETWDLKQHPVPRLPSCPAATLKSKKRPTVLNVVNPHHAMSKKAILFYFNILKCASPSVLINLQCPTTQVGAQFSLTSLPFVYHNQSQMLLPVSKFNVTYFPQLCVPKCPDRFATYSEMQYHHRSNKSYWEYYRQFCKPGFDNPNKAVSQVLRDEDCPSMIMALSEPSPSLSPPLTEEEAGLTCSLAPVPSPPAVLQRCFPDFITRNGTLTVANRTAFKDVLGETRSVTELRDAANGITSLLDAKEVGMKIFEDYASSWYWILIGLLVAMVVSLIFILLLRFTAGFLLWFIIFAVIALVAYGIWHCYEEFVALKEKPSADVTISDIGFQTDFHVYLQLSQTWLVFMISLSVTEAVIILMLIFLRNRVRIAIALLKEGSKAIGYIMSTLFYPIVTFLLLAVSISYWAVTAVYPFSAACHIPVSLITINHSFLASSGDAIYKVMPSQPNCMYANLTCNPETFNKSNITKVCPGSQCMFAFYGGESPYHRYIFILQLCNLLVFLWLVNFTIALGQCTLAGAFASYYWALKKPADIPPCPLFSSFSRAIRYHTGSLAFGSLILAVVQLIRIVLEYLDHKLKGAQNTFARFLLCCLKCCFWCLERVIKFMNRNAYIMIAIYGKNFCTSAREAFFLLMRNVVRVAVLDKVTDFLLFLGKVLIAGSVGALAFLFFTHKIPVIQEEVPSLNYYWVPLLTVTLGSYLIAHGFFSVYAMCVDTLFLCFLLDLENNNGSAARPYHMSTSLRKILNKRNRKR
ncbi:choline transporter-like protein 5-like [Scleropages formosus]|uniref:Choline transporter-like protein 5-like n=1 Tax=Scleropages formosus TaxID=113540 RepID=A0A0P7VSY2_SCLFO|nr:choline transporter-like protein 5-like [Scleropages formosus]